MIRGSCEIRIWIIWTQSQHSLHSCAASQIQTQAGLKFHLYKFINFIPFFFFFFGFSFLRKKGKESSITETYANIILILLKNHSVEVSSNPGLPLET